MKTVRALLAVLAVAATLLLSAGPASAHAQLLSSDPKNGDSLEKAPAEAVLKFSERIDAPSTQIALTSDKGGTVPTEPFTVDGTTVTMPLYLPTAGVYTIGYRIVSEDGHRVDGKIAFTVKTPSSAKPSGTSTYSTSAAPKATGTAEPKSGTAIYWIIGGLVVVALIVVVVLVLRRKPSAHP